VCIGCHSSILLHKIRKQLDGSSVTPRKWNDVCARDSDRPMTVGGLTKPTSGSRAPLWRRTEAKEKKKQNKKNKRKRKVSGGRRGGGVCGIFFFSPFFSSGELGARSP